MNLFRKCYVSTIYTLLYLPIAILILYSCNDARFSLRWHGFSIRWYQELLQDTALWQAFFHSIGLGVAAASIACLLSLLLCVPFFLKQQPLHRNFYAFLLLSIILPDLVLGVALLIFFNSLHIPFGFITLLIAHITFCLPFTILTLYHHTQTLDINVYISALDLGATRIQAFYKILLPALRPALLSAFLLGFTLSFDDVILSYFVSGPEFSILPLTLYGLVRSGITPELNALCTVTLCLSMLLIIMAHRATSRD